jgi:hypothetical protein
VYGNAFQLCTHEAYQLLPAQCEGFCYALVFLVRPSNWKSVEISLKSFDVNAVTMRDVNLAKEIQKVLTGGVER